ncbi:MAG: sulfur carrier protein ThiS [Stagnimonas sp.]|nr:sulfur carrier protein ThiS [Stagnimonas sp.]
MALMVNGRQEALPDPATLEGLVDALNLTGQRLAIEHNGQIVPRSAWAKTTVLEDDRIEIVKAIGGG